MGQNKGDGIGFIRAWQEADFADASIGGVDSVPEEEYADYVDACLMALSEDFEYGWEERRQQGCHREARGGLGNAEV